MPADTVLPFRDRSSPGSAIASLRNLGPASAARLASIGITTRAQLARQPTLDIC
ncbi:MAG: hypothetical protein J6386_12775 [Candidatus Synoicihabitans palmerolidicus]|nr:hypothetical protein [Candidatus Synoicihabitans palmerolidicus]